MDFWSAIPIPLLLLLCAAALMGMHVRTWRTFQQRPMDPAEQDYHGRQFRRRMQSSGMLGVLAVAIFVGQLISNVASPVILFAFWGAVALMVVWVAMLAVADILATKYYYGRLRRDCLIERAKLQARLNRMENARGNGKSDRHRRDPDLPRRETH